LPFSVPVYNYLLDKLEDQMEKTSDSTIKEIIKSAINKIKAYYPTTDGNAYIIATGKFDFIYINILLFLLIFFLLKY
jgi:hypothetical protein